jgi:hypothetical protein
MPYIGKLGDAGLAKETVLGTFVSPTEFIRFIPPLQFSPDIELLIAQSVGTLPDDVIKTQQGPSVLKSGKMKFEVEPENIGNHLMAAFGTDTMTEVASFVVTAHTVFTVSLNTNDYIDFTEDGGGAVAAQLTAGAYTVDALCTEIKTQMESAGGAPTYTVTFSATTKKFTITKNSGVFVILWNSGTNNAKAADTLLGFSADTDSAISATSATAVTYDADANDAICMTEDGGAEFSVFLTAGTYSMAESSATAGSLCKLVKDIIEAGNGTATYTVTYSRTTLKMTITKNSGVFVLKWTDGVNARIAAMTLLGFTANSASAIAAVSDSTTENPVITHTFTRVASASLSSYSWWHKNGVNYPTFAGCMLNKLEFDIKAKEFIIADADWAGLLYAAGSTDTVTYSAYQPFKFDQAALTVGGSSNTDIEELKLVFDNMVEPVHVVGNTINATKIYSKGFRVTISGTLIFEDSTEYAKFIAGTATSFVVTITGVEALTNVTGTVYPTLTFNIPSAKYQAFPLPLPRDIIKVAFTAVGIYDTSTSKTANAALKNSVAVTY